MEVKITQIEEDILVGGFSIERLETDETEPKEFFNDFMHNGKMELLNNFTQNLQEYYGLIWFTEKHEKKYQYLLGQKLESMNGKPDNLEVKVIEKGEYAVSKFSSGTDAVKAITDFFNEGIPRIGYKPKEQNDMTFEYYPNGLDGEYEFWTLVEKI